MTTPTTNRQYAKPTVGADSGTWGTELNTLFDLVDKNMGTNLSLSVAGAADVTLTAAQAANLSFNFTGVLTGSINVIWPAAQGGFSFITNSTSGAFTLTAKVSGGTGIVIPQSSTQYSVCFSDATNMYAVKSIGGVILTGTVGKSLTVSNTLTLSSSAGDGKTIDIGVGAELGQLAGAVLLSASSYTTIINFTGLAAGYYAVWICNTSGGAYNLGCLVAWSGTGLNDILQTATTFQINASVNLQAKVTAQTFNVYYSRIVGGVGHA